MWNVTVWLAFAAGFATLTNALPEPLMRTASELAPREFHAGRPRHAHNRRRTLPALGVRLEVVVSRIRCRRWRRRGRRRTAGNRQATRLQEISRPALQEQLAVGVS